jgi:beta-glucosidase
MKIATGVFGVIITVAAMSVVAADPSAGAPVVHPDQWPVVRPALAPDPVLESRLTTMIAAMTPEQKVGQLIQPDIASITPEDLRHFDLGSILNGGNSSPNGDEFASPSEWLALADRFYDAATDAVH